MKPHIPPASVSFGSSNSPARRLRQSLRSIVSDLVLQILLKLPLRRPSCLFVWRILTRRHLNWSPAARATIEGGRNACNGESAMITFDVCFHFFRLSAGNRRHNQLPKIGTARSASIICFGDEGNRENFSLTEPFNIQECTCRCDRLF